MYARKRDTYGLYLEKCSSGMRGATRMATFNTSLHTGLARGRLKRQFTARDASDREKRRYRRKGK
jgi:hypothetical protein